MGTLYQIDFLLVETFLDISCFILRELLAFSFLVVKKLTSRMLCGLGNTRHRYYHWRFCGGNILLSVSGGPLEYPK